VPRSLGVFPGIEGIRLESGRVGAIINRVSTAPPQGPEPRRTRFRVAVVVPSVIAAGVGSILLAMHRPGETATTRGVVATLLVPSHPGSLTAGPDALWVGLAAAGQPVRDRPLLRLDLASGAVEERILLGGQVSYLTRAGARLLASVEHVGGNGSGPSLVVALDWLSGRPLVRRQFPVAVGPLVTSGKDLWALDVTPATLLRLDPRTLVQTAAPLPLSTGPGLGLAVGGGYVWATAPGAAELLRIDPATRHVRRVHVGGAPSGIAVADGAVWFADAERGEVERVDVRTLRPAGTPIRLGGRPTSLVRAGRYLFAGDASSGTVRKIDPRTGETVGPPIRIAAPAPDSSALAVAAVGSSVWVSSFASNTLSRVSGTSAATAASAVTATTARSGPAVTRALPRAGLVVARIPVPPGGGAFTVGEGAVWAMSDTTSTMLRIDPRQNAVVARIKVPPGDAAAAGDGAIWFSHPLDDTVSRIDPRTNRVVATIHVGLSPAGVAVSRGAVWVANAGGPSVSRIDPATNAVVAKIRVGPDRACCSEHMSLIALPGAVWVAVPNANELVRIDPASNAITARVEIPYPPCGYVVADRAVWSAGGGCGDVVARVDTGTRTVTARVDDPHPVGLGLAFGSVWVAVLGAGVVDRIDPSTGRLTARLPVGGKPVRLSVGFGSVWVNDDDGSVLRIRPRR
jgi:YVTN family beta-propeller protein